MAFGGFLVPTYILVNLNLKTGQNRIGELHVENGLCDNLGS